MLSLELRAQAQELLALSLTILSQDLALLIYRSLPMLSNKRYFPPPRTTAACQHCQDLNLSHPTVDGILGIPLSLLQASAASGCPYCELLIKALELPGLEPPNNEELFGVTLFSGVDSTNAEPLPLTVRLQTEYTYFAEVELYLDASALTI